MKEKTVTTVKKVLPLVVIAALLLALMTAALLPAARRAETENTALAAMSVDGEAMQKLTAADAYARGHAFTTEMHGVIKARVFGIPYSQKVKGRREVDGDTFTDLAESKSAFVKAGVKKTCANGAFGVARGDYKKGGFVYGKEKTYDRDGYESAYGKPYTGIVKYELKGSVTDAKKNADGTYTFVFDPRRATAYSRNEVRTTLGGKSYPEYESVSLTLTVDGERPVKVTVREKFTVDKFGGTHCTAEYTETFDFGE